MEINTATLKESFCNYIRIMNTVTHVALLLLLLFVLKDESGSVFT